MLPWSSGAPQGTGPHILLVLDQFPKSLGGGERIALRLASLLPSYGYRVSILSFFIHPQSALFDYTAPCPVYQLPLQRTYDLTALRAAFALRGFLRQQDVRIVQTFFESSDLWAGLVVKTLSRAKLIWSRRDMGILRQSKHSAAYRLMANAPDRVFAVSEQVRRHAIEVDRIDPSRVQTIYNGLDLPIGTTVARTHAPGAFHITTVGNIRRVKGHDLFIQAAATVMEHFPDACFSIAGEILEPDYFAELERLVQNLNLTGRFRFVGGISNLSEHFETADLFVLPSRSEGFSNAILEAMAGALPVIATDVGGNAEAVEHGRSGLIIPPENAAALAAAILQMLADPALARQMGVAGKALAAERFTTEAMMRRITTVYADLLANR